MHILSFIAFPGQSLVALKYLQRALSVCIRVVNIPRYSYGVMAPYPHPAAIACFYLFAIFNTARSFGSARIPSEIFFLSVVFISSILNSQQAIDLNRLSFSTSSISFLSKFLARLATYSFKVNFLAIVFRATTYCIIGLRQI